MGRERARQETAAGGGITWGLKTGYPGLGWVWGSPECLGVKGLSGKREVELEVTGAMKGGGGV